MTDANSVQTDSEVGELTIVRIQEGPIQLVWELMTTPEHLTHFWGPTGTSTPLDGIVMDLRPGGAFETTMVNDSDGETYVMKGTYVEIDPPHKLVWTEADTDGGMTTTTTYKALGEDRTEVTIHQVNVPVMFLSDEAQAGFRSSLDRSDAYLASLLEARA